ncbi:MAG: hypothetical protein ACRDLP_05695 [Solirubrobacteraceae bacterium]
MIGRRPAVAAYRVIDEDELLGGTDWLEPAPERRPATRRPRRLRVAVCATTVVVAVAAGLLAGARPPHPLSPHLPPAAPPLTRPMTDMVRPAPAIHRGVRVPAGARHHRVMHVAAIAVAPSAAPPPPPAPPSAAQEFGFER